MWVVVILTTTTWTGRFFFSILAEWSTLIYFVPYSLWVQRKHMSLERQKVQTSRRILTLWKQKAPLRSTGMSASIMSSTSYWGRDFWNIVEPEYFEIKIIVYLLEKQMPPQTLPRLLMPRKLLHLLSSQQKYQASYGFVGNPYYLSDSLGFFTAGWLFELFKHLWMKSLTAKDYQGSSNVTQNGFACKRWDQTTNNCQENSPNDGLEENFYRNPDEDVPSWCMSMYWVWDYCNTPICGASCSNADPDTCGCEFLCFGWFFSVFF